MKLDRHHDPEADLERDLLHEIELCVKDLGGKMQTYKVESGKQVYTEIKITYGHKPPEATYEPSYYQ
tara:strand:- start:452 stop:652 length:201 start_codon:yes stop_codon:yes gene_type:complete